MNEGTVYSNEIVINRIFKKSLTVNEKMGQAPINYLWLWSLVSC